MIKKLILKNKFFISSELNTDILEKTFEGGNVCRIWNNVFRRYFQHIESKTSNILRNDKVVLAFRLTQPIGRERWFRNFKNYHRTRRTNNRKTNIGGIQITRTVQRESTLLVYRELAYPLKIIRTLITIIFIGFAAKNQKNMTPHHEMNLNSLALHDRKATYALTRDRRKRKN